MVWTAISTATGQTIATGNTAAEAYNNAIANGYPAGTFTVIQVGGGPRV